LKLPGRLGAAIEILTEILERRRPASEALRDWGKAHRFAGSGDRHAIGTLVYDGLRNKRSASFCMGTDTPRAIAIGVLKSVWNFSPTEIAEAAAGEHGPGALTEQERQSLAAIITHKHDAIAGDIPEWLLPSYQRSFGAQIVAEAQALSQRAPIDLRTNTLKATREDLLARLERFGGKAGPLSPWSIRIAAPGHDEKHTNVEAEPAHGMGWFEVQDSASQVAALMSGAKPGMKVADICAGAGGKTLALAAMMKNQGHLIAHDRDRHRLRPIFERITRSGATNIEVLAAEEQTRLESNSFDCVVIDAPCSGSGSWRRKPDAKWRLTDKQLAIRVKEQVDVMERGAVLVRTGGTILYITCSVLPEENTDQVKRFLKSHPEMKLIPYTEQWKTIMGSTPPASADGATDTLLLTPASHGTDGFFMAVMKKA
jgi:16S rRNA (cytosine967-C5)-methyltransferase